MLSRFDFRSRFSQNTNAKIDFSEGNLILQKDISVVPFLRKVESFVCNISLISSVKIPPKITKIS